MHDHNMIKNVALPLLILLASLSGCAFKSDKPSLSNALKEVTNQNGRACVRTDRITGYGVRKSGAVNIDSLHGYYVATVRGGCMDLQTSASALFEARFNEICGGRADRLITGDGHCAIDQIFQFNDRAEAFSAYDAAQQWRQEAVSD